MRCHKLSAKQWTVHNMVLPRRSTSNGFAGNRDGRWKMFRRLASKCMNDGRLCIGVCTLMAVLDCCACLMIPLYPLLADRGPLSTHGDRDSAQAIVLTAIFGLMLLCGIEAMSRWWAKYRQSVFQRAIRLVLGSVFVLRIFQAYPFCYS